jgi:predicted adenine nucleotide alpha hydrolase (AANH) superfamily ATPase
MGMREKLLLHSCCGPCSTACVKRLCEEGDYDITVFFYNPGITETEEYEKRKENQIKFLREWNAEHDGENQIGFAEGDYLHDRDSYFHMVRGLENEPEGGRRCAVCFTQRLSGTVKYAQEHGFPLFTTTLTVSPHKNYPLISGIAEALADQTDGVEFLDMDFKKKDGFLNSTRMSKKYGLYRQNYCGCIYSKKQAEAQREEKAMREFKKD